MAGMPLMVVARNLGHVDTTMVEKHYGHFARSYVVSKPSARMPVEGSKTPSKLPHETSGLRRSKNALQNKRLQSVKRAV